MSRGVRLLAVVVAAALVLAACGDSGSADDDGGNGEASSVTTSERSDTDATLGTIPDIPGIDDECLAMAQLFGSLGAASLLITGQTEFDQAEAQAQFEAARRALPDALQGDIDTVNDAMNAYFQALADLDIDFSDPQAFADASPEDFAALEEVGLLFDTPEVDAAFDNLSAYAEDQCPDFVSE